MSLSLSSPRSAAVLALLLAVASTPLHAVPERLSDDATDALARLRANTGGDMQRNVRADSGYAQLRASGSEPLMASVAGRSPTERAQTFLSIYGAAIGIDHAATQLVAHRASTDLAGKQHVHMRQVHKGVPVFGARVAVHMTDADVTGLSGVFIRNLDKVSLQATRDVASLRAGALGYAGKLHRGASLSIQSGRFVIYPVGLVQGHLQAPRYAYEAIVGNRKDIKDRIFVDARTGEVLDRFTLVPHVLNREAYNGDIATAPVLTETSLNKPADPPLINDPGHGSTTTSGPAPGVPADNLFVFAGGTWALYFNMFGRDGYDFCDGTGPCESGTAEAYSPLRAGGNHNLDFPGQIQQSVYLIGAACPNAYWNGESTNYCPGFDADDVVSHEWSHGYTEYTSDLVYAYQSGALNESYSDIFGETYDLTNNIEGPLGALTLDEHQYYEDGGSRWVVGEDLSEEAAALLLRDMWKPDDFPATTPGKATSSNFVCGSGDGGGVHTNSSVPNHAYAMIVDGTAGQGPVGTTGFERDSYNGQQFDGIGMVKAAHIYFHAQANYQTDTTDFPAHADYLRASCADLIGVNLKDPTGALSGQMITAADCEVVNKAMLATEMDLGAPNCPYVPVLKPTGAPVLCPGAATIFSEDWESGEGDWTKTSTGRFAEWEDDTKDLRYFVLTNLLPGNRDSGTAAFAKNIPIGEPGGGTCQPGGDYSGAFTFDSPSFTIPVGAENLQIRFDHYVNTEATADGGQLEISTDDGVTWTLVAQEDYIFNFPNSTLLGPADLSNNPDGGEYAWNGSDINAPSGSEYPSNWGTTVVNLSAYAEEGNVVKLRFKFAQEGCNGRDGWYIDDILVHSCPLLGIPVLSVEDDYEDPDTDGEFTLSWERPAGASGPDLIQTSETSCAPVLSDDAETDLSKWVATTEGSGMQAWSQSGTKTHGGDNSFFTNYTNGSDAAQTGNVPASILTLKDAVTIPTEGETRLDYYDWFVHEGDDGIFVEVSTDDGVNWAVLHQDQRFFGAEEAAPLLASEPMFARSHSLEDYKGQSIKVRFRFQSGGEDRPASTPFGWYVDDIAIINDNWGDLLTTPDTSETLEGQLDGSRCYRVRTIYTIGGTQYPSEFSNIEGVTVDAGLVPPVPGVGNTISNNRLGGALPPVTLLLLALFALGRRRVG